MTPRLLLLADSQGLNFNLLKLAVDSFAWETEYVCEAGLDPRKVEKFSHILIDDRFLGSWEKTLAWLGNLPGKSKLYYLGQSKPEGFETLSSRWNFIPKPLEPRELKDMILKNSYDEPQV